MSHIRKVPSPWDDFLSLVDTPSSYAAQGGKFVRVNSTPDALEFTDDVVPKSGTTMTGYLTLHADPTNAMHAVTKQYVDSVSIGLDFKESVRLATTTSDGNLDLNGAETIDGKATAVGNRILVKNQSTASENGIYVVAAGAWTRAEDANSSAEVTAGMFCFVEDGNTYADTGWVLTTNNPITLGSTGLTFTQFSGPGSYTEGNGIDITNQVISADFENTDGNILAVGTQDAGVSNKVARADHVHAHGDQLGGSLHADVVAGVSDGFMTEAMATKLAGIAAGAEVNQNAFSNFDINAAEVVVAADGKTDTVYFIESNVINITGNATNDSITFGLTAGSEGQVVKVVSGVPAWATLGASAATFLELTDTPSAYTSKAHFLVRVDDTPDALEFLGGTGGYTLYFNGSTGWETSGIIYNDHSNAKVGINSQAPNSTLHNEGSYSGKVYTTTASYDLGSGSNGAINTLLCNNTSGSITITLPAVSGLSGRTYHIKKISAATNDVVVDGASTELIDGAQTFTMDIQYESITIVCNGSAWYIV